MGRRRFVLVRGELVELTQHSREVSPPDAGALWGDRNYTGLRATDGTDISTRSKHREYMRARGLTTMDDYHDEWGAVAKRRAAELAGEDPTRKWDIADVIYGRKRRDP